MIKIGEHKDIEQGVKLLKEHIKEFSFSKDWNIDNNDEYYKGLMTAIAGDRTAVVSENDGIIDGVLLGIKVPNLYNPNVHQLHILLTWVSPSKRGSSIFVRMMNKLEKEIKHNHKNIKDIIIYSIPETPVDYSRLNYKQLQTTHIKEIK